MSFNVNLPVCAWREWNICDKEELAGLPQDGPKSQYRPKLSQDTSTNSTSNMTSHAMT